MHAACNSGARECISRFLEVGIPYEGSSASTDRARARGQADCKEVFTQLWQPLFPKHCAGTLMTPYWPSAPRTSLPAKGATV